MKELHALVDFENVQPSLEALAKLAPGFTDVWLFHGPHQAKRVQVQVQREILPDPNPGWVFKAESCTNDAPLLSTIDICPLIVDNSNKWTK